MYRTARMLAALGVVTLLAWLTADAAPAADAPKADAPKADIPKVGAPKNRVVVMYFHRTQRCPTCLKMGAYTEEAVKTGFAKEVKAAKVALHFIDFQDEKNATYVKAYEIVGPTLIVAKVSGKKVVEHKSLEDMWSKVVERELFVDYVQENVKAYLK